MSYSPPFWLTMLHKLAPLQIYIQESQWRKGRKLFGIFFHNLSPCSSLSLVIFTSFYWYLIFCRPPKCVKHLIYLLWITSCHDVMLKAEKDAKICSLMCVFFSNIKGTYWLCSARKKELHVVVITMHEKYVKNPHFFLSYISLNNGLQQPESEHKWDKDDDNVCGWDDNAKKWGWTENTFPSTLVSQIRHSW